MADAHVVCRMLGYPRAVSFTTDSRFGGAKDGPIWLDEVNCTGNENTLAACPHDGWGINDCDHTEDAGVVCDYNFTVDAKGGSGSIERSYTVRVLSSIGGCTRGAKMPRKWAKNMM